MPIRFPKNGNPLYPLPPNYLELGLEGRRLARINALSLRERAEDFVWSWKFFRDYYLSDEKCPFYLDRVESSWMHEEWAWFWSRYPRNALLAPRGSAKSTIVGTEFPLLNMLMGPQYPTLLILSKDEFVEKRMNRIRQQLEFNGRLRDDFGDLKPSKGSGLFNLHTLTLTTGAQLQGLSIDSKARGERSKFMVFDDVEHDPETSESEKVLTERLQEKFARVFLPMAKMGSSIFLIATGHRRNSFSYHIVTTKTDPLFANGLWNRRVYVAEDNAGKLSWAEGLTKEYLEQQKVLMGSAYQGEYMNEPAGEGDRLLRRSPITSYNEEQPPSVAPLDDHPLVHYQETTRNGSPPVTRSRGAGELRKELRRFITVDYASSLKEHADRSGVHTLGIDTLNQLWSLDLWSGKVRSNELINIVLEAAHRWRVEVIGVEAISLQQELARQIADKVHEMRGRLGYAPRVVEIKYKAKVSKIDRIAGLEWRFNQGLIKLPNRTSEEYRRLLFQVDNFTRHEGALDHDDELDTLAMAQELLGSVVPRAPVVPPPRTLQEKFRAGELWIPGTDIPWGFTPQNINLDDMDAAMEAVRAKREINTKLNWSSDSL